MTVTFTLHTHLGDPIRLPIRAPIPKLLCSVADLTFYTEQIELAQQAWDLTNKVYEEAKVDGNPKVREGETISADS